ncbi:MAG: CDP-alcohol phosphatidyltransferase family protein [Planctomycetes bacterium]|nr:CDP-alcohol phosphatidyltransferase family protein [Planctomycetota bacterium]
MMPLHNLISVSRYALTVPVAALAWDEATQPFAVVLAILVGVSDFVDGPLARRAGDAKPLGALLDMTGDKVFLCTMLIVLAVMGRSPAWAAWLITSRELIVLFLRVVAAEHGKPLPIAMFGKLKTFMLYILVPIALADASWQAVWFLAWASTLSALSSLVEYIVKMRGDLAAEFCGRPRA